MRSLLATTLVFSGALAAPATASAEFEMCMVIPASGAALTFEVRSPVPAPLEKPEGVVLWCANEDDPRCSPVRNEDRPQTEWQHGPLRSGGPATADVAAPASTTMPHVSGGTAPSSGVRHRVERPPRA
jgi:hypothetical protein